MFTWKERSHFVLGIKTRATGSAKKIPTAFVSTTLCNFAQGTHGKTNYRWKCVMPNNSGISWSKCCNKHLILGGNDRLSFLYFFQISAKTHPVRLVFQGQSFGPLSREREKAEIARTSQSSSKRKGLHEATKFFLSQRRNNFSQRHAGVPLTTTKERKVRNWVKKAKVAFLISNDISARKFFHLSTSLFENRKSEMWDQCWNCIIQSWLKFWITNFIPGDEISRWP